MTNTGNTFFQIRDFVHNGNFLDRVRKDISPRVVNTSFSAIYNRVRSPLPSDLTYDQVTADLDDPIVVL